MPAAEATWDVAILEFRARVAGPPSLLRALQALFPPAPTWSAAPDPAVTATIHVRRDTPRPGWHQIARDGTPLWTVDHRAELLPAVEQAINATAVERLGNRYLLLHAGAVACAGRGLVLPAPSGHGKTTLVAGLVAAGFQYLSDEVAALAPPARHLMPFPKSLCVKRGAHRVLARLYPQLVAAAPRRRFGGEAVWYLPPDERAWPSGPVPVRWVVLPRYVPGARTVLAPVPRSAAVPHLLQQSFNLRAQGAQGIGGVVEMLRGADCYTLTVGRLQDAVDLLLKLATS